MASGRQTKLTGAAGEFLVAAELCRRGLMATPFAGNVPHYDVIASGQHGGHVAVQVKAVTRGSWQFNASPFVEIEFQGPLQVLGTPKSEPYPDLKVVMVSLGGHSHANDCFYVLTWYELQGLLIHRYRVHLERHAGQRPRAPNSTHVSLPESDLEPFRNRWEVVVRAVDGSEPC